MGQVYADVHQHRAQADDDTQVTGSAALATVSNQAQQARRT
jgi:hypothetical protein